MKRLLELISKNKLLIVMLIIALAVGAVLQLAEEPFAWISIFNAEWRHGLGCGWCDALGIIGITWLTDTDFTLILYFIISRNFLSGCGYGDNRIKIVPYNNWMDSAKTRCDP
nr:hypothetical protein [Providencia sp. PROV145]